MQSPKTTVALTLVIFVATCAVAGEPRNKAEADALLQSSYTRINGKETPDLIPYHIQMGMFFSLLSHYIPQLQKQLNADDLEKLKQFSAKHGQLVQQDADTHLAWWKEIAARAEPMSAVEIATEMKRATSRIEDLASSRYRAVIGSLSSDGRNVVSRFVQENIRPVTSVEDELVVAEAAPIFYKEQILGSYKLMLEGKWPPAPPTSVAPQPSPDKSANGDEAHIGTNREPNRN